MTDKLYIIIPSNIKVIRDANLNVEVIPEESCPSDRIYVSDRKTMMAAYQAAEATIFLVSWKVVGKEGEIIAEGEFEPPFQKSMFNERGQDD